MSGAVEPLLDEDERHRGDDRSTKHPIVANGAQPQLLPC